MDRPFSYAEPRAPRLEECFFYHVMDLPGVGRVGEQWDLRDTIGAYLGHFDFRGKRVLDVGAASGFLTFEMEKRGADVVSFDIGCDVDWDIAPFDAGLDVQAARRIKRESRERLLNAYWFAHRALGSSAKAYYGNIYDLPTELGGFDVVVLGSILLHLRDPFLALDSASRLARKSVIVIDLCDRSDAPTMRFLPDLAAQNVDTWWSISEKCMSAMLATLGFAPPVITRGDHLAVHAGKRRALRLSTYVAHRRSR